MTASAWPLTIGDIRIRDPFVVADRECQQYYLYASAMCRATSGFTGVEVYTSPDLQRWSEPTRVLELSPAAVAKVWAPEVFPWHGRWYLFTTLTGHSFLPDAPPVDAATWPALPQRGTYSFIADHPRGPFRAHSQGPLTPAMWSALDGTLHFEEGVPWLVFCHEWTQIIDGAMMAVRLSQDLARAIGEPQLLFKASSAPGSNKQPQAGLVTDGPFLHRTAAGELVMLWSTWLPEHHYSLLAAHSQSGRIGGPWLEQRLVAGKDGGHGMIFQDLHGEQVLALHRPNHQFERLHLFRMAWSSGATPDCALSPYHDASGTTAQAVRS